MIYFFNTPQSLLGDLHLCAGRQLRRRAEHRRDPPHRHHREESQGPQGACQGEQIHNHNSNFLEFWAEKSTQSIVSLFV